MRTSRLNVRLSADETAALAALAADRNTTISAMVRGLLDAPRSPEERARAAAAACPPVADILVVHERLSAAVYTHARTADELSAIGDSAGAEQARRRADAIFAAAGQCADLVGFARAAEKVRGVKP